MEGRWGGEGGKGEVLDTSQTGGGGGGKGKGRGGKGKRSRVMGLI